MVELRDSTVADYIRYVISALILIFSCVVTFYAIIERQTGFWHVVPGWAALILFIVDLFLLGIVEGLQIALVELKRQHPDSYKHSHPGAYHLGQLAAKGDNVERFLMGRQVFVVFLVFFAAKLTTILLEDGDTFLFPAPHWFRAVFLETGILACVVIVIIAQLMPQIVAAKYPVHFLQFIIMKPAYYTCIFVELTGLTHICWVLSALLSKVTGMRLDEFVKNETGTGKRKLSRTQEMIDSLDDTLNAIKVEDNAAYDASGNSGMANGEIPKEKALGVSLLDVSVTQMGQQQYRRLTTLVETINNQIDPATLVMMRHYLDNHPEKFHQFPTVIGNKMYPSPQSIAETFTNDGLEIPKFLTDISDPEHVPPHIVACELLAENKALREQVAAFNQRSDTGNKTKL